MWPQSDNGSLQDTPSTSFYNQFSEAFSMYRWLSDALIDDALRLVGRPLIGDAESRLRSTCPACQYQASFGIQLAPQTVLRTYGRSR